MSAQAFAGEARARVNGENLAVRGDITINGLNRVQQAVVGLDGFHGRTRVPMIPSISISVSNLNRDGKKFFAAFQGFGGGDVVENMSVENANTGNIYTLVNAGLEGDISYSISTGEANLTFTGSQVIESGSA